MSHWDPAGVSVFPGNDSETGNGAFPVSVPPLSETGNTLYLDVAAMLDGTLPEPPEPVLLERSDGACLFYAGEVNVLFGDPECGKTMVADAAAAEALGDGRRVAIVDLDHNGPTSTLTRLLMLGAPIAALRDPSRFRYVEPDDQEHLLGVVDHLRLWRPAVAVVDSLGELIPLMRGSSNSPDDFTVVNSRVMKPLAVAGAAVIGIDHLAKNADSRDKGSTGTAAKRRVLGGSSIRVKLLEPFTPGKGGKALLTVNKDRHGGLRQHCPHGDKEPVAGTFTLSVRAEGTIWSLRAPNNDERNPAEAAPPEDVDAVRNLVPVPTTVRDARQRLGWGTQRASNAMRDFRAFPVSETQGTETENAPCTLCGEPMAIDDGTGTHPTCEAA